jgi:hypothetical protein
VAPLYDLDWYLKVQTNLLCTKIMINQYKSGKISINQEKSGKIRKNQEKSGEIRENQKKSGGSV